MGRGNIPSFIHVSDGKQGDVNVLDILVLEAGAFYIMDRSSVPSTGTGRQAHQCITAEYDASNPHSPHVS